MGGSIHSDMKYPKCILGSIESPGEYWLVSQLEKHVEEVRHLQSLLSKDMKQQTQISDVQSLELHNCVAVRSMSSVDVWHRGKIICKLEPNLYIVFLIDCGTFRKVSSSFLKPITDKKYTIVEPLAFKLCLYGVVPVVASQLPDGTIKKQASEQWSDMAIDFVQNFFYQRFFVYVKKMFISKRTVYGDIYVQEALDNELISLRRLLCSEEVAVFAEEFYLEKVMKIKSEVFPSTRFPLVDEVKSVEPMNHISTEFQMKQERIKQWQMSINEQSSISESETDQYVDNAENVLGDENDKGERLNSPATDHSAWNELTKKCIPENPLTDIKETIKPYFNLGIPDVFETLRNYRYQGSWFVGVNKRKITNQETSIIPAGHCPSSEKLVNKKVSTPFKTFDNKKSTIGIEVLSENQISKLENSNKILDNNMLNLRNCGQNKSDDYNVFKMSGLINYVKENRHFEIFKLFNDSAVKPVDTFRHLNISPNIILNLEKYGQFKQLSAIQRWAIPSIQRGHDVAIISSAGTGKTLSYIIPLLDALQDPLNFKELPCGNGPTALILCSGFHSCNFVYQTCLLLLKRCSDNKSLETDLRVQMAHGIGYEKEALASLTNGCDILVSTPHCFTRVMEHRTVTNLERLRFLVLDDVDKISEEPFLSQIKIILHQCKTSKFYQKIFCGARWTRELAHLSSLYANNHALIIGSYLEVAIYARLKPVVFFSPKEMKSKLILDCIKNKIGRFKIFIACESESEVLQVNEILTTVGSTPLIAHSNVVAHDLKTVQNLNIPSRKALISILSYILHGDALYAGSAPALQSSNKLSEHQDVLAEWKASEAPVIICSDDVLHELNIQDAEILIHFSLPYKSKTNFGNRFSTLLKSCENRKFSKGRNQEDPDIIVMVDDENHYQLPHIVEFLIRLGCQVSEKVLDICQNIQRRIERNKTDAKICTRLLEFGKCNERNCTQRHAFIKEIDYSGDQFVGSVKFKVLEVYTVCHLSAQILENVDKNNEKKLITDFTVKISDELRMHFEIEENRKILGKIQINEFYAIEVSESTERKFYRVVILEIKRFNKFNQPMDVCVKLIDTGRIMRTSINALYELPENFKKYPPQAIDVYICNLLPRDFDSDWGISAVSFAQDVFLRKLKDNQFWIGKVILPLKNSLHLNAVKLCHTLENLNINAIDFCVYRKLLSSHYAVENKDHVKNLLPLCENAHISLSNYGVKEKVLPKIIQPQWAFFDCDMVRVHFSHAENTSLVFVRLSKFESLLKDLEKDCEKEVDIIKTPKNNTSSKTKWVPIVGVYCLAAFENKWNRARIESMEKEKFSVYFIDYGDTHTVQEVLPLSEKLLMQLPAQAIECSLAGLKHSPVCKDEAIDEIYEFSDTGAEDLYASVIQIDSPCDRTGGKKYHINLLNLKGISLNKKLVDSHFVEVAEDSYVPENIDIVPSDTEDADRPEEVEDDTFDHGKLPEEANDTGISSNESNDVDDVSHFLRMEADVFDDENARLFLKDFISQHLPKDVQEVEGTESKVSEGACADPEGAKISDLSDIMGKPVKSPSREYPSDILNNCRSSEEKTSVGEVLFYTPKVLWSQDHSFVYMKIILTNVITYKVYCQSDHLLFSCLTNDRLYAVDIKLFGAISPQLTEVRVKTFLVQISLRKLCPFAWVRLHRDKEKYRWINIDVEGYLKPNLSYSEELCKNAIDRINKGHLKIPNVEGEINFVPSSDYEDYATDSDDDDNF